MHRYETTKGEPIDPATLQPTKTESSNGHPWRLTTAEPGSDDDRHQAWVMDRCCGCGCWNFVTFRTKREATEAIKEATNA